MFKGSEGLSGTEGYKSINAIHLRERNLYGWGSLFKLVCHEFGHYIDTEMRNSEIIDKITQYEFEKSKYESISGVRAEQRANWIKKSLMKKYLEEWNEIWR